MYGYTPQQVYGTYGTTYSANALSYGQQTANAAGTAATYPSTQQYTYPNAASAYAQYNQATQQATAASSAAGYGTADYTDPSRAASSYAYPTFTDYANAFKATSGAAAAYGAAAAGVKATTPTTFPSATNTSQTASKSAATGATQQHYAGYEAAVMAAASSYLQAKNTGTVGNWMGKKRVGAAATTGGYPRKHFGLGHNRADVQQFFCEICKVSCAGSQTFKVHQEGKSHKKKEAASKKAANGASISPFSHNRVSYRCDVCEVDCSGRDSYDAHVKGAKHQKTISLLMKLNKPIPSAAEPTIIKPIEKPGAPIPTVGGGAYKKVVGITGTKFVGGTKLTTTGEEVSEENDFNENSTNSEPDVKPIGEEFIQEQRDSLGKFVAYNCKLCDCKFGDVNAKNVHLKGRRHRLQYKAKINPELRVEMKKSAWPAKGKNQRYGNSYSNFQPLIPGMHRPRPPAQQQPTPLFPSTLRNNDIMDDRHVLTKVAKIQLSSDELSAVEKLVSLVEKSLKDVSDSIAVEASAEAEGGDAEKVSIGDGSAVGEAPAVAKNVDNRILKGVMRVGLLAKNLLLKTDKKVQLVVLCLTPPTVSLLMKVFEKFKRSAEENADKEKVNVEPKPSEAGFLVSMPDVTPVGCLVVLTCAAIREQSEKSGAAGDVNALASTDALPILSCLNALAELRHAKFYQVKCATLQSMSPALKVIRDIGSRVRTWAPLSTWAMELLLEKTLSSVAMPLGAGAAVRRLFEIVASGVLLHKGSQPLLDPCEKTPVDVLKNLSDQEREDITSSAQHALRLIAFNQIYKILAIERLPDSPAPGGGIKRLREWNANDSGDGAATMKKEKIEPNK